MVRSYLGRIRGWVGDQSLAIRGAVVVGALAMFWTSQQIAAVAEGIGREGGATFVAVSLPSLLLAFLSLYLLYAVGRSLLGSSSSTDDASVPE